jgi:hypothetical protein
MKDGQYSEPIHVVGVIDNGAASIAISEKIIDTQY